MKRLSKFLALFLVFASITVMFSGCSSDEITLMEALVKNQSVKSMEAKVDMSIKLDISDFPEEDMQKSATLVQLLNNMNMTFNEKMVRDIDKGTAKAEILSNYSIGGLSSYANIWVDTGDSEGKPYVKEIFQLPPLLTAAVAKDLSGKDYIVLDTSSLEDKNAASENVMDYSKFNSFNKEIMEKTSQFYLSYAKNLKPGFEIAKHIGTTGKNGKFINTYKVKLSDAAFKDLLSFLVNDLNTNKENLQLVKDYFSSIIKLSMAVNPEAKLSQEEINGAFSIVENQLPSFVEVFNKYMDALEDVTILGKDGISIVYTVDENGYITGETSSIDLSLDLAKISEAMSKLSNDTYVEQKTGKINLKVSCDSKISKINENIDLVIPETTEDNSVNYLDLMDSYFESSSIGIIDDKISSDTEVYEDVPSDIPTKEDDLTAE